MDVIEEMYRGNIREKTITPDTKRYIFVRHFYACASILGALTAALLWGHTMLAIPAGALVTVTLRLIAASRKWSLPRAKLGESCAG